MPWAKAPAAAVSNRMGTPRIRLNITLGTRRNEGVIPCKLEVEMKTIIRVMAVAAAAALSVAVAQREDPFLGPWDLTITEPKSTYPDWLEISRKADGGLAAVIQPRGGGRYNAAGVKFEGSRLTVSTRDGRVWELTLENNRLTGVQKRGDAVEAQVAGARMPALKRPAPAAWNNPEPLFNGKDLTGWEPMGGNSHWVVENGEMVNQAHGANIKTTRQFDDLKLHVEFNCPDGGNSGIYLRGRYEVQIEYEPTPEDKLHMMGSIYSALPPTRDLPRTPGKWESFDVTLVGRHVTVRRNNVQTIDADIPGITGGAIDSDEAAPGPFYIQGDHTGGLRFRNITVAEPKK